MLFLYDTKKSLDFRGDQSRIDLVVRQKQGSSKMHSQIHNPSAYEAGIKRNIVMNARTTFNRTYPDAQEMFDFLWANANKNSFYQSLLTALDKYGKLTEKQVLALRNSIATQAERKAKFEAERVAKIATMTHVGQPGKKVTMTLTVKAEIEVERTRYHWYDSGMSLLRICEDENGNAVVYTGTAEFPLKGQTAQVVATVKSHREYRGAPQTVISRPKILSVVQPQQVEKEAVAA